MRPRKSKKKAPGTGALAIDAFANQAMSTFTVRRFLAPLM
jgi:hypothetical protein